MSSNSSLKLPTGDVSCKLHMINTGTDLVTYASKLVTPVPKGFEQMNLPTFSWLIVNERNNEHVLFDLGARQDWENYPPHIVKLVEDGCAGIKVSNTVPSILKTNGIPLDKIKAAVISHFHYDHTGDLSLFPHSTDAIFGPEFKSQFAPFYPTNPQSPFHEYEFEGRNLIEMDSARFETNIAGLKAHDYFNDGSFYLIHAPGHTKEHLCGLVRTTTGPDSTFVLLGGDSHHFGGMLRPSPAIPLPDTLSEHQVINMPSQLPRPCPCHFFTQSHRDQTNARTEPFFDPAGGQGSFYIDAKQARETLDSLQELDALDNVFVTIAHDPTLGEVLPTLDSGAKDTLVSINDWRQKGWKEAVCWGWLKELPRDGKQGMPPLVDGQWRDGKKIAELPTY